MAENENTEFVTPPPPTSEPEPEQPEMSEPAMIGNVFFEPGRVFQDQRRKARFILGGLLIIVCFSAFQIAFVEKFGLENIVRARFESSKRTQDLPTEQKESMIKQQSGNIAKYITYGATPLVIAIVFFLGGLLYWGGTKAMGGEGGYLNSVAVWIYSGIPPTVVFLIANMIVLFLKSPDDIDLATSQGGLLKASPAFFIDPHTSPVLAAFLGNFDLFGIWGWVLAAIGLQKVAKISSGAAWTVVLILGVIKIAASVIGAMFF